MKWTENISPNDSSYYDHTICETPLGIFIIEWKSWKSSPGYDISLDGSYIGTEYELSDAKDFVRVYLVELSDKLLKYLKE